MLEIVPLVDRPHVSPDLTNFKPTHFTIVFHKISKESLILYFSKDKQISSTIITKIVIIKEYQLLALFRNVEYLSSPLSTKT